MFKDQKEELQRLEEELLKDKALYDPELPEGFDEELVEDTLPEEFDEALIEDAPPVSEAWNSDDTDADLEQFSREVYEAPRPRSYSFLGFTAMILLLAAVLGWLVLKERGLLP